MPFTGDRMAVRVDGKELKASNPFLAPRKTRSWIAGAKAAEVGNLTIKGLQQKLGGPVEQNMQRWETLRSKGMPSFILRYGVLGWGLTTGILFLLYVWSPLSTEPEPFSWLLMVRVLVSFPIGGIVWGYVMWLFSEWRYQWSQRRKPSARDWA